MRSGRTAKRPEFEEIFNRFEIPLLQYARRITGDREQARDVVQETFVKFQRNGALRREDEPATWLFTVCRNAALNVCRKERRMMYLDEEVIKARETEQPMPFDQLLEKEATGFLLQIVGTLPPRQQEVIQLKFQAISVTNRSRRSCREPLITWEYCFTRRSRRCDSVTRKSRKISFHLNQNQLIKHECR
jgi:RNA polymerase sigma factor (sigma-70 family)